MQDPSYRRPCLGILTLLFLTLLFLPLPVPAQEKKFHKTASGLEYWVPRPGERGRSPKLGDRVQFHYTGWLDNRQVFATSRRHKRPIQRILGISMPRGLLEGLQLMAKGSTYKLRVPPELGFGARGLPAQPPEIPAVPPHAHLVYEVELIDFEPAIVLPTFRHLDPKQTKTLPSGLAYQLLKEGKGVKPEPGKVYEIAFSLWNREGQLVATSRQPGQGAMAGVTGEKPAGPAFLQEAMTLLRLGDRYLFEVPAELCYGKVDRGFLLPPDSVTIWELELVALRPKPRALPLPPFSKSPRGKTKRLASGLKYEVIQKGEGRQPEAGDKVVIHYAGWLVDGTPFDSSFQHGVPTTVELDTLIAGWKEGILLMRKGDLFKFTIPSGLAFRLRGKPALGIGPNATLIFHTELLEVIPREDR